MKTIVTQDYADSLEQAKEDLETVYGIEPLNWTVDIEDNRVIKSQLIFGHVRYQINKLIGKGNLYLPKMYFGYDYIFVSRTAVTLDKAKAACQTHYEQEIKKCLVEVKPVIQETTLQEQHDNDDHNL